MKVTNVYFSPGGTTKEVAKQITATLSDTAEVLDLLKAPPKVRRTFSSEDVVVVAMPVFSGRIPSVCVDMLNMLNGDGTPAVAVVVYGNRHYEDALLELSDILAANGFRIMGGCAAVARHSIFPKVAASRPDSSDVEQLCSFGRNMAEKIRQQGESPVMPGNTPYREVGPLPLLPAGDRSCNKCGACAKICPVGAINADTPRITNAHLCINCTACIYSCPQKARRYSGIKYNLVAIAFGKKCKERQEPAFFV